MSSVHVFDLAADRCLMVLPSNRGPVRALAFAHLDSGAIVLAGGCDEGLHLWDAITGKTLDYPGSHREQVRAIAFGQLPDSSMVLISGGEKLHLWAVDDRAPYRETPSLTHWQEVGRVYDETAHSGPVGQWPLRDSPMAERSSPAAAMTLRYGSGIWSGRAVGCGPALWLPSRAIPALCGPWPSASSPRAQPSWRAGATMEPFGCGPCNR
jgi:WD40 repeat protein